MTAAATQTERRSMSAVEQLLRDARDVLTAFGVGHSKASRLVRAYVRTGGDAAGFADFVVDKLRLDVEHQRQLAVEWAQVLTYADPVGEEAVGLRAPRSYGVSSYRPVGRRRR